MKDITQGIILVGSVAYAPNESVKENSDLDLVIIYDDIRDCVPLYFKNKKEQELLLKRKFDGYLIKYPINNVPISIHNISYKALQSIVQGNYESLTYYRPKKKDKTYHSLDFDGLSHPFNVASRKAKGLSGVVLKDNIAFESQGKYILGNDMDKLLSNAQILHDTNNKIKESISVLWNNITHRLVNHRIQHEQILDINNENIMSILCRKERMSATTESILKNKTKECLKNMI